MPSIAFITRFYDDDPLWPAFTRRVFGEAEPAEWGAYVEFENDERQPEEAWFEQVDAAIAWARERSAVALVRLGSREDAFYAAGSARANQRIDGSGGDYPEWPPDNWPDYKGPEHEPRRIAAGDESGEDSESEAPSRPDRAYGYITLRVDAAGRIDEESRQTLVWHERLQIGDRVPMSMSDSAGEWQVVGHREDLSDGPLTVLRVGTNPPPIEWDGTLICAAVEGR